MASVFVLDAHKSRFLTAAKFRNYKYFEDANAYAHSEDIISIYLGYLCTLFIILVAFSNF